MNDKEIKKCAQLAQDANTIPEELYEEYDVKRGLRNKDFTGVLVGLTKVGGVKGYKKTDDGPVPIDGELYYRGIEIKDLVGGFLAEGRYGFDECTYLLLFGHLPNDDELETFSEHLAQLRDLPEHFTDDMILKLKGKDIMNMLSRSILALYALDENPDDLTTENIIRQSMDLIAKIPAIISYSYHAMRHRYLRKHLVIRHPKYNLSTAENFLYILKGYKKYTELEAKVLDLLLVLHLEHGGGNNSSFATHVVSSSGTDTYSAIAAAIGSLKGPLHGGANIRVMEMMDEIKTNVRDWKDETELKAYLAKILDKEAGDKTGKIYGFGHAVYTLSDPRAVLIKEKARELAKEKDRLGEFELYESIARLAPQVFKEHKQSTKIIAANVDYYSGFVYDCIGVPKELCTPMFAAARIVGWCSHRIEELVSSKRIIRPAYKAIADNKDYSPRSDRS